MLRRIREIADFTQSARNCLIHEKSNLVANST